MEMRSDRHFSVCPKKRPDSWNLKRGDNLIHHHQVLALNAAWIESPVTRPDPMAGLSFEGRVAMSEIEQVGTFTGSAYSVKNQKVCRVKIVFCEVKKIIKGRKLLPVLFHAE